MVMYWYGIPQSSHGDIYRDRLFPRITERWAKVESHRCVSVYEWASMLMCMLVWVYVLSVLFCKRTMVQNVVLMPKGTFRDELTSDWLNVIQTSVHGQGGLHDVIPTATKAAMIIRGTCALLTQVSVCVWACLCVCVTEEEENVIITAGNRDQRPVSRMSHSQRVWDGLQGDGWSWRCTSGLISFLWLGKSESHDYMLLYSP